MDKAQNNKHTLLPFSVIEAAATGNVDAINAVLKHYEPYRRWQPDASMTKTVCRICAWTMSCVRRWKSS